MLTCKYSLINVSDIWILQTDPVSTDTLLDMYFTDMLQFSKSVTQSAI